MPTFGVGGGMFAGLHPREVGRRVWARFETDALLPHAAPMSFFLVFALFPAFRVVVALLGLLPLAGILDRLLSYTGQILPPHAASVVDKALAQLRHVSTPFLSLGAGAALWPTEEERTRVASTVPLGRLATPHEVAAWAAALCSQYAGYITGETLTIDGGHWLAQESYMPALQPRH